VDIFKHTPPKKNKKIKRADQILPEVYGTTLGYFGFPIFRLQAYLVKNIKSVVRTKLHTLYLRFGCSRHDMVDKFLIW